MTSKNEEQFIKIAADSIASLRKTDVFRVSRRGATLAKARGRLITMRDRHDVEIHGGPELFVVFAMLVLQMDRRDERRKEKLDRE